MKHAHHGHHKKHKHQIPPHVTAFIVAHINGVRAVSRKYNIPVSIILAQGALESGWGLKVVGNAFFGVKGKAPDGGSVSITTHENTGGKSVKIDDNFRAYKDFDEAADDYARMLTTNKVFAPAMAYRNEPVKFIDQLGRYATDPLYKKKLHDMLKTGNLLQYDAEVK